MERPLNALMALILSCVLIGALWIQFFDHETPCPLCYLQRVAMMGLGISILMNVFLGIKRSHYGMGLIWCFFGGFVALRHVALHACPGFPTFGKPVFGISLYTWSFFIFSLSVLYIASLLLTFETSKERKKRFWWEWSALGLLFFVVCVNIVATFIQCGFGPCEDV